VPEGTTLKALRSIHRTAGRERGVEEGNIPILLHLRQFLSGIAVAWLALPPLLFWIKRRRYDLLGIIHVTLFAMTCRNAHAHTIALSTPSATAKLSQCARRYELCGGCVPLGKAADENRSFTEPECPVPQLPRCRGIFPGNRLAPADSASCAAPIRGGCPDDSQDEAGSAERPRGRCAR